MDVEPTSAAAPAQGAAARRPIGEFLVERGLVTTAQLQEALVEQRKSGKRLGEILVERGAITRMALASVLGEQWEEAGRHLRAVVPVRLAGGKEAESGLAGGEELTDSLASLQAAVARLEELSGGPRREPEGAAPGFADLEIALTGLADQLTELQRAVTAPVVVESDLGERFAELDAFLRSREADDDSDVRLMQSVEALGTRVDAELGVVEARLSELAEAVTRPAESDTAARLDRIDAWLREHDRDGAALAESVRAAVERLGERLDAGPPVDTEVHERLARIESALAEPRESVVPDVLAKNLAELRDAVERPRDSGQSERFDRLEELLAERPPAAAGDVAERLASLEHALHGLRGAVDASRDETLAERVGGLEAAVRDALERPRADSALEAVAGRLDALRAAVESRPDDLVLDRLAAFEHVLTATGERLAGRDLAWEAAVARLGRLEDALAESRDPRLDEVLGRLDALREMANTPRHDSVVEPALAELAGRLDDLRGAVDRLGSASEPRDDAQLGERFDSLEHMLGALGDVVAVPRADEQLVARLESLEHAVGDVRAAVESRPDDAVLERLTGFEQVLSENRERLSGPDLAWEAAVERLGRLEAALSEALARSEEPLVFADLAGRLDALHAAVQGVRDDAATAERFTSLEQVLAAVRAAVESRRDDAVVERLEALEGVLAEYAERLAGRDLAWEAAVERLGRLEQAVAQRGDASSDEALARLEALREAVEAPRDGELRQHLGSLEAAVREASASREDGRLDEALARLEALREAMEVPRDGELRERLGSLETAVREASAPREDGRLDEALSRLADLRVAVEAPRRDEELAERIGSLESRVEERLDRLAGDLAGKSDRSGELVGMLRRLAREATAGQEALAERLAAAVAELRSVVEAPRDGAVNERLDRVEAALAAPDPSLERLSELQARVDALAGDVSSAQAAALAPMREALDELRAVAAEPAGARFLERLVARSHNQIAERIGELEQAFQMPGPGSEAAGAAAVAERDAHIAELTEELRSLRAAAAEEATSFVALVPSAGGYRLVGFPGRPPSAGDPLELPEENRTLVVARVGRSPFPDDVRPCAYLHAS